MLWCQNWADVVMMKMILIPCMRNRLNIWWINWWVPALVTNDLIKGLGGKEVGIKVGTKIKIIIGETGIEMEITLIEIGNGEIETKMRVGMTDNKIGKIEKRINNVMCLLRLDKRSFSKEFVSNRAGWKVEEMFDKVLNWFETREKCMKDMRGHLSSISQKMALHSISI